MKMLSKLDVWNEKIGLEKTNSPLMLGNILFIFVWLLLVVYLSYHILHDANWIFGDNSQFWRKTAVGNSFVFRDYIWVTSMRFNPLFLFDFNILLLFSEIPSAFAHYLWSMISFVVFSFFIALLMKNIEKSCRFSYSIILLPFFFVAMFFIKDFMVVFIDIIYPERMVVLCFSLFMLCYYKAIKSDSLFTYLLAIPFVVIASYNKEPVFGAMLVVALFNLIFHYQSLSRNHKIFIFLLIINAVVFLSLFYVHVYSIATGNYAEGRFSGGIYGAAKQIFHERILLVGMLVAFIRAYFLFFMKDQYRHSFFDATLFAGLAYATAYVFLKLPAKYYVIPAIVLVYPSLFYWTLKSYGKLKIFPLVIVVFITIIPLKYNDSLQSTMSHYHSRRLHDIPVLTKLSNFYSDGFSFVLVEQPIAKKENAFMKHVRSDSQSKVLQIMTFLLGEKLHYDEVFTTRNTLHTEDVNDKTIILYSAENNIEQDMHKNTKMTLDSFYHPAIKFYNLDIYYPLSVDIYKEIKENLQEVAIDQEISANNAGTHVLYIEGWSSQEGWGRWTDGEKTNLLMKVSPESKGVKLSLAHSFVPSSIGLDLTVLVNGIKVSEQRYTGPFSEIDIPLPQDVIDKLHEDSTISIDFLMPNRQSPKELGLGEDTRKLGFGLATISTYGSPLLSLLKLLPKDNIAANDSDKYLLYVSGWSVQEDWGRWTDGEKANLLMKVSPESKGVNLSLAHSFMLPSIGFDLTVLVNGIKVSEQRYTEPFSEIDIPLPQEVIDKLHEDSTISIDFLMPNRQSPKELGLGEDTRKLGFGLEGLEIY